MNYDNFSKKFFYKLLPSFRLRSITILLSFLTLLPFPHFLYQHFLFGFYSFSFYTFLPFIFFSPLFILHFLPLFIFMSRSSSQLYFHGRDARNVELCVVLGSQTLTQNITTTESSYRDVTTTSRNFVVISYSILFSVFAVLLQLYCINYIFYTLF